MEAWAMADSREKAESYVTVSVLYYIVDCLL